MKRASEAVSEIGLILIGFGIYEATYSDLGSIFGTSNLQKDTFSVFHAISIITSAYLISLVFGIFEDRFLFRDNNYLLRIFIFVISVAILFCVFSALLGVRPAFCIVTGIWFAIGPENLVPKIVKKLW